MGDLGGDMDDDEMGEGSGGMYPGGGGESFGDESGGAMGGYGVFGGPSTQESTLTEAEQFRVDISKRRAWSRLRNVLFGLTGFNPRDNLKGIELIAVQEEQLALLKELAEPIEALRSELDKRDDDEEPLTPKSLEKAYKTASSAISEVLARVDEADEAAAADPEPAAATDSGDTAGLTP